MEKRDSFVSPLAFVGGDWCRSISDSDHLICHRLCDNYLHDEKAPPDIIGCLERTGSGFSHIRMRTIVNTTHIYCYIRICDQFVRNNRKIRGLVPDF